MTITFLDPRDKSTKVCSTSHIKGFITELKKVLGTRTWWNAHTIHTLINGIKNANAKNETLQYINIDVGTAHLVGLVELAEKYKIPILLNLSDMTSELYTILKTALENKKCLKYIIFSAQGNFQYMTNLFIESLLTTDIYGLKLDFITVDVAKFFKLIEHNKLINIELSYPKTEQEVTNFSSIFNLLLQAVNKSEQPNILRTITINKIPISGLKDEANTTYLTQLIQENVNLAEIFLVDCQLSANFLDLLSTKLLATKNISSQPLKLDLSSNPGLNLAMPKFVDCLAANVNINDLSLNFNDTGIDAIGLKYLGAALELNNILNKLSLARCHIGPLVKDICQGIMNNPQSQITNLIFYMADSFDLTDAHALADLIRSNKIKELNLSYSFYSQLSLVDKLEILQLLLDALSENTSLIIINLSDLIDILTDSSIGENIVAEISTKIKYILATRTKPLKFVGLYSLRSYGLEEFMQLQFDNQALSDKTLIQILREYKK